MHYLKFQQCKKSLNRKWYWNQNVQILHKLNSARDQNWKFVITTKVKENVRENTSNITNTKESIFESFSMNEKDISNAINGTWLNENIGNNGISYIGANFKKQDIIDDKCDNNIRKHINKDVPYVSNEVFGVSSQMIRKDVIIYIKW